MTVVRADSPTDTKLDVIEGGVAAPAGIRTAAVHCGIKKSASALDLTVIASDQDATAAGIFTTNLAQAAPVIVSRRHLAGGAGAARAVVVNSGCANACTGEQGMVDAERMTESFNRRTTDAHQ